MKIKAAAMAGLLVVSTRSMAALADVVSRIRFSIILMKLLPARLLIAVTLLGAGVFARGQVDIGANLETYRTNRHMPGLMAVCIKSGRIVAEGAAGYRRQGHLDKLLLTDRVNLASNTKWMTATIAARLVDRGVIGWNTRVCDLFTNYHAYNAALTNATLDQLLAHRSGVQQDTTFAKNHWNQLLTQNGSLPQLRRWVSDAVLTDSPEVTPGNFLYSNPGYAVAAAMLETASGEDWETLIHDEIFAPLRMSSAKLGPVYDDALPPKTPVGHDLNVGQTVPVPRTATSSNVNYFYEASNGAGAYAASTLQDWAKFLHMHMTSDLGSFLTASNGLRLQQAFPGPAFAGADGYSRGAYVYSNLTWALPGNALYHGGDAWGEDSLAWMSPSRDFIVIAYVNCHSADNSAILAMSDAANFLISAYSGATASGPWLETPTVLAPRPVIDGYAFDYLSLIGVHYRVESSVDLHAWASNNGPNGQMATNLQSSFTDTNKAALKFYRVHVLP